MPTVEKISLPGELRRISAEMDRAGMNPDPGVVYCTSKYDSDLIRDAAKALEASANPVTGVDIGVAREALSLLVDLDEDGNVADRKDKILIERFGVAIAAAESARKGQGG